MLWYVLQSIDVSASPTSVSACGDSSTLSTTAYFKLFTKNEDNTTSADTNTSETVTASASYSENKNYTSVNSNILTFTKNNAGDCYGADSRTSTATASYTYSGVTKTDTVTVTQKANPLGSWYNTTQTTNSISISPSSMSFESAGGKKSYSVTRYYTQYQAREDSCNTVVCRSSYNTSSTVTPSDYETTGDFECTSSSVSIDVNSGSERTGTLTVSYDGKSDSIELSQAASQAGTVDGEPYDYSYSLSVSVSPWNDLSCDGGTTYATAYYVTSWKYDWEELNDAGEVIDSGTSSDSSSRDVTNSTTWSTTRGTISSNGTLTYPASTSSGTVKTTVTGEYNGYSDTDYMTQVDCSTSTPDPDTGTTSCMTIYYTLSNGAACTVYFKTTNDTQQGSHYVDATGSQSLCNIAEDTELVVSCDDSDVTVGGDTTFTYTNGGTASISLTKSGGGTTLTNNCGNLVVNGRDWALTLPYAATSNVTFTFNAVNCFSQGGTTYSDWTQTIDVSSGSKTGTARSSTTQFTKNVTFDHASPSADTKYIYCSDDISASSGETETPDTGTTTCTASNNWTGISATVSAGKCDTSPTVSVTAKGTHTNTDCSTTATSTTLNSSNYTIKYGKTSGSYTLSSIEANETTSQVTWYYSITASTAYGSKTTTSSFKQSAGPCTDNSCTCSVSSITVSPSSYSYTSTTEEKSFSVTVTDNDCSACTGNFLVYKGSTYVTSGSSSFKITNGDGTYTIRAKDNTGKTATLTLTKYTAPAVCDCDTVSISCNPTQATTTGNSVETTVTVTGGTNCVTTWKAYSDSTGELLHTGSTGSKFSRTTTGSVTFRADACTGKSATFKIVNPTITGLYISNNQPGEAKIKIPGHNEYTLDMGTDQTYAVTFTSNSTVTITYNTMQWKNNQNCGQCMTVINFTGANLIYGTTNTNNVTIDKMDDSFWVKATYDSSCSGSLVTYSGTYTININFIFEGNSQS